MFKDLFIQLLHDNDVTAAKLSKDTGLATGLISQWKSGRQLPKYDSLKVLCDYFCVSADYLLERETSRTSQTVSVENVRDNIGVVGQANAPATIHNNGEGRTLTKQEQDLLRIYNNATTRQQLRLMDFALSIEEEN